MASTNIKVEFFFAAGCSKCAEARDALREAARAKPGVDWKEVDVAKNPNRTVDLGVVSTPAVAIDGELIFKSMPTPADLRRAIEARLAKA